VETLGEVISPVLTEISYGDKLWSCYVHKVKTPSGGFTRKVFCRRNPIREQREKIQREIYDLGRKGVKSAISNDIQAARKAIEHIRRIREKVQNLPYSHPTTHHLEWVADGQIAQIEYAISAAQEAKRREPIVSKLQPIPSKKMSPARIIPKDNYYNIVDKDGYVTDRRVIIKRGYLDKGLLHRVEEAMKVSTYQPRIKPGTTSETFKTVTRGARYVLKPAGWVKKGKDFPADHVLLYSCKPKFFKLVYLPYYKLFADRCKTEFKAMSQKADKESPIVFKCGSDTMGAAMPMTTTGPVEEARYMMAVNELCKRERGK